MTNQYPVVLADPPWSYHGTQTGWADAAKHSVPIEHDLHHHVLR